MHSASTSASTRQRRVGGPGSASAPVAAPLRSSLGLTGNCPGFLRPLSLLLLAVAYAPLAVSPLTAQEWTRFRGPNGTGLSSASNIPTSWTEEDYAWRVELSGAGHSSPVVWGDRVFLTSASDDATTRHIECLSLADGQRLWQRDYPSTQHTKHTLNSFASPTAAVDDARVYVSWSAPEDYTLLALTHDGQDVWRQSLGPYVSQHSAGPSPIVYQDLVILGNDQDGDSYLAALDRATGTLRWQLPRQSTQVSYSTPCVRASATGEELIFCSGAHGITAVDPLTGKLNWEFQPFDKRTVSSPILSDNLVFGSCGSGGGGNFLAAVRPQVPATDAATAQPASLAYKLEKSAPYVPTGVFRQGRLFLVSEQGVATCLEAESGRVIWQQRLGGKFFGSPICVEDRLYAMSESGEAIVWRAADEFEVLARNPIGELSHSTPAVAGGRLLLRTERHLICLGPK